MADLAQKCLELIAESQVSQTKVLQGLLDILQRHEAQLKDVLQRLENQEKSK